MSLTLENKLLDYFDLKRQLRDEFPDGYLRDVTVRDCRIYNMPPRVAEDMTGECSKHPRLELYNGNALVRFCDCPRRIFGFRNGINVIVEGCTFHAISEEK